MKLPSRGEITRTKRCNNSFYKNFWLGQMVIWERSFGRKKRWKESALEHLIKHEGVGKRKRAAITRKKKLKENRCSNEVRSKFMPWERAFLKTNHAFKSDTKVIRKCKRFFLHLRFTTFFEVYLNENSHETRIKRTNYVRKGAVTTP